MNRWTRCLRGALPLLAALAVAGCLNPAGDDHLHENELSRARGVWADSALASYTYELTVQCTCENTVNGREVRVTVRNGAPAGVAYLDTNPISTAPAAAFAFYDTVDDLFALIEDAIDRDADVLQVGYHPTLRYPVVVNVNYDLRQNGDEVLLLAGELARVTSGT